MTPEMWIVSHAYCNTPFLVPEKNLGQTVRCPMDGGPVHLPSPPIRESETLHRFREADWLRMTEVTVLFQYMGRRLSERKQRLFAVACCSKIRHLLTDKRSRKAVRAAEQYADGLISKAELAVAGTKAGPAVDAIRAWERVPPNSIANDARYYAANAAQYVARLHLETGLVASQVRTALAHSLEPPCTGSAGHQGGLASLFRDIAGSPFRPVAAMDSAWLTWNEGTVRKLATSIYQENNFADLPVLADALEEAGCTNTDLLLHCREDGDHVRGCWAVDVLLGKK
jgi:hypothetical protein